MASKKSLFVHFDQRLVGAFDVPSASESEANFDAFFSWWVASNVFAGLSTDYEATFEAQSPHKTESGNQFWVEGQDG